MSDSGDLSVINVRLLRGQRSGHRGYFTKVYREIETNLDSADIDQIRMKADLSLLTERCDLLKQLDEKILNGMCANGASEDDIAHEIEESGEVLRRSKGRIAEIEDMLSKAIKAGSPSTAATNSNNPNAFSSKLPRLNLVRFDGSDIRKFSQFMDTFVSEVDSKPLDETTKFRYLVSLLDGQARERVAQYRPSKESYAQILAHLHADYGNKNKIINAHIESLYSIVSANQETAGDLRRFLDGIRYDVGSLGQLGLQPEHFGPVVTPQLFKKLPYNIQMRLLDVTDGNIPTLQDFIRILEIEVKKREDLKSLNESFATLDITSSETSRRFHAPPSTVLAGVSSRPSNVSRGSKRIGSQRGKFCQICQVDSHGTFDCSLTVPERRRKVQPRCYICFKDHHSSQCQDTRRCGLCHGKHHTLLHLDGNFPCGISTRGRNSREPVKGNTTPNNRSETTSMVSKLSVEEVAMTVSSDSVSSSSIFSFDRTLLKTAKAEVQCSDKRIPVNILFDEGSQTSYLSESCCERLNPTKRGSCTLRVNSFGGTTSCQTRDVVTCELVAKAHHLEAVDAVVVPKIVQPINQTGWSVCKAFPGFEELDFADPYDAPSDLFEVDLLIGMDQSWRFLNSKSSVSSGHMIAQASLFGFVLSGPVDRSRSLHLTESTLLSLTSIDPVVDHNILFEQNAKEVDCAMHETVQRAFSLDSLGFQDDASKADDAFAVSYRDKIVYSKVDSQYVAPLPWKTEHPVLPSNLNQCLSRLRQVKERLLKLNLFSAYDAVIQGHEAKRYIEPTPPDEDGFEPFGCHYLAHFPVLRPGNETTPVRVVHAANAGSVSLNDCLETGPNLLNNLVDILLRFRVHKVAFCSDIEKAFLCVQVREEDRNFLRFLWFRDGDPSGDIVTWRYRCLTFGPTSSPFILNSTIKKHLELNPSNVTEDMSAKIYMDNLISGTDTEDEAVQYYHEARCVMQQASMNLRQWITTSSTLRSEAQKEGVRMKKESCSVLGMVWDSGSDTLVFPNKSYDISPDNQYTKRSLLAVTSTLFDPYGFLTPLFLPVKSLLSAIWDQGFEWDVCLPSEMVQSCAVALRSVSRAAAEVTIPRWYGIDRGSVAELHLFVDASHLGLGAVLYLVSGPVVQLVISRLKIVSKKKLSSLTTPKLELMAMVLGVNLVLITHRCLQKDFHTLKVFCWTDSEICLHWLHSSKPQKVFIRNRVSSILKVTCKSWWSHVPSSENPADLITRGCTYEELVASFWWVGPVWLCSREKWPARWVEEVESEPLDDVLTSVVIAESPCKLDSFFSVERFGTYQKLLHTVAFVYRFLHLSRHDYPREDRSFPLSKEVAEAECFLVRASQQAHFSEELAFLNNPVGSKPSLVRQLNLFVDSDKILRAAGRLQKTDMEEQQRCPMLLPKMKDCRLTKLVIEYFHRLSRHAGIGSTLVALRRQFWILSGRTQVRMVLYKCVPCRYQVGQVFRLPEAPALPVFRVSSVKPFSAIGIDFSGALLVRDDRNEYRKVYICIFSCCTTRNVNVELVGDMSTEAFLLAFRAHCADFSYPSLVICDNARTFKKGDEDLQRLFEVIWSEKVQHHLVSSRVECRHPDTIRFQNIPVKAPWWGGFYERFVGLVKLSLKKVLGRACIHVDELRVLLKEIRSVLNDRPLTYVSSESSDLELGVDPISPSLLLYGFPISALPHPSVDIDDLLDATFAVSATTLNRSAKRRALLFSGFVRRFRDEYMAALRERHAWQAGRSGVGRSGTVRVGDVCLVCDDGVPRVVWKLGVVEKLLPGPDGQVRAVSLRTAGGKTNRSVGKLVPLEVQAESTSERQPLQAHHERQEASLRPRRQAAQWAATRIREQFEDEDQF